MLLKKNGKKEKKNSLKVVLVFLLFVCILIFLSVVFRFYSGFKTAKFKNLDRVNIVIDNGNFFLVSLSRKGEIALLELPVEKKIKLARGFGEYSLASVYRLGELEGKGGQLLVESLQSFLAVPVDGLVKIGRPTCGLTENQERKCLQKILFSAIKNRPKTGISGVDLLIALWRSLKTKPGEKINVASLGDKKFLDSAGDLDLEKIDLFLSQELADSQITAENISLAVFNTTETVGLASQATRLISNLGGRVVSVDNAELRERTVIVFSEKVRDSYTLKRLVGLFFAKVKEDEEISGRAQIEIYLGKDYWKMLNEKW